MLTKMQIRWGESAEEGAVRDSVCVCVGISGSGLGCVCVCAISYGSGFKEISLSTLIRTLIDWFPAGVYVLVCTRDYIYVRACECLHNL